MTVEEAILQMNLLGHTFFLFRDDGSGEVNVVYKRNDGKYGVWSRKPDETRRNPGNNGAPQIFAGRRSVFPRPA